MSGIDLLRNGIQALDRRAILHAVELLRENVKSDRAQFIEELETPPQVVQQVIETVLLPKAEEVCDLDSCAQNASHASLRLMRSNQQLREQLAKLGSSSAGSAKTIEQLSCTLNFALNELRGDIAKANSIDYSVVPLLFQRLADAVLRLACVPGGQKLRQQAAVIGQGLESVKKQLQLMRQVITKSALNVPIVSLKPGLLKRLAAEPHDNTLNNTLREGIGIAAEGCAAVKSRLQDAKSLVARENARFGGAIDLLGRSCSGAFQGFSNRESGLEDKLTSIVCVHGAFKDRTVEVLQQYKSQLGNIQDSFAELKSVLGKEIKAAERVTNAVLAAVVDSLARRKLAEDSMQSTQSDLFKSLEKQQFERDGLLIRYRQAILQLRNAAEGFSNDVRGESALKHIERAVQRAKQSFQSAESQLLACRESRARIFTTTVHLSSQISQLSNTAQELRQAFKPAAKGCSDGLNSLQTAVGTGVRVAALRQSGYLDVSQLFSLKSFIQDQVLDQQRLFSQVADGIQRLADGSTERLNLQKIGDQIADFSRSMTELSTNRLSTLGVKSAVLCLTLQQLERALGEVVGTAWRHLEQKHQQASSALRKLHADKQMADTTNMAQIQALKTQIESLQQKAEAFETGTQTETNALIETSTQAEADQQGVADRIRRSDSRQLEQQPEVTILSLPKDPAPALFIQYYSQPHYDFDSIIYSPEELHPILVTTFKELRSRKAITSRTNAMVNDAYKRISAFFTEKQELQMLCTQFGVEFQDSDAFREAFRNFVISKYNVAMEAFFGSLLDMIFLDVVPSYCGAVKPEVRQLLGNLFQILLQMSLQNYKCAKVEAASGKAIIFPKMVNDQAQSFDALQVDVKDLAK